MIGADVVAAEAEGTFVAPFGRGRNGDVFHGADAGAEAAAGTAVECPEGLGRCTVAFEPGIYYSRFYVGEFASCDVALRRMCLYGFCYFSHSLRHGRELAVAHIG